MRKIKNKGFDAENVARPDDGLLEVITLKPFGRLEILRKMNKLFRGSQLPPAERVA